jgi:hypothetical protein
MIKRQRERQDALAVQYHFSRLLVSFMRGYRKPLRDGVLGGAYKVATDREGHNVGELENARNERSGLSSP